MSLRAVSLVDHAGVVVHHGLCKGILLATVQQEHIEGLLDFLLAFDADHLARRRRHLDELAAGFHLLLLRILLLDLYAHYEIVHGTEYALAHRSEGGIESLNHRAFLTAVGEQAVPVHLGEVVLGNLTLDTHVLETYVARNHIIRLGRVIEIFLNVPCKPQAGLQFGNDSGGSLGLGKIASRSLIGAHHHVLCLECVKFALHITQFLLYDGDSLRKELRRVDCHLVLVRNRLLVVNYEQHVEDIDGPVP